MASRAKRPANAGAGGDDRDVKRPRAAPSFAEELAEEVGDDTAMRWQRVEPEPLNARSDDITFQWLDIDMYEGEPLANNPDSARTMPGARKGPVPVIRLFGVTREGHSVLAHVHGFTPYFYCRAPPGFEASEIPAFQAALEQQVRRGRREYQHVLAVQAVRKQDLYGYRGEAEETFLQVYMAMPNLVPTARSALKVGFKFGSRPAMDYQCYEANNPFLLRFLIDTDIAGCAWLRAPRGAYKLRNAAQSTSGCQVEIDVVYDSLVNLGVDGEWQQIAPFRILSFDIECAGRKGHFPEPEHDPVIQIANVVTEQGSPQSIIRNVFVLGSCTPIVGARIHSFEREEDMLVAWSRFVRETDVDILTGYNIDNFDMPYLMRRAKQLGIDKEFALLGRIRGERATMRDTTFQSAAHGKRENIETTIHGRVMFDMLEYTRRNHKLSSYSLNAVSAEFLGQAKEDVHHSIIADLHHGSADDRRRLAVYCLKDAFLPQRLMDKLMVVVNHVEMARVTGVPLDFLLRRGQQIKVLSMLYRRCRQENLVIPSLDRGGGGGGDETYEGATVIQPKRGFYDVPIATLDFASLYPSIMMAHNLCYSTLISRETARGMDPSEYEQTPAGHFFVKPERRAGILPRILRDLLAARKVAKADMKKATDPMVKAVQNGRQLALKVSANSVYGFTGATVGQLPCLPISESVTAYGRQMIDMTKEAVEETYVGAIVVYGDSVVGDTALVLRVDGRRVLTTRVDEVVPADAVWEPYGAGKECCRLPAVEVWQDGGFTPVDRIIRHRVLKPLVRVLTHTGVVDCTTDHSLLLPDGAEVSPTDVELGTELLHEPNDAELLDALARSGENCDISPREAFAMGMFYADGSCSEYGEKYTWAINNTDPALLLRAAEGLGFRTRLLDTMASSGVYKLVPLENICGPVRRYRRMFYNEHREKRIPPEILSAPLPVLEAFWAGFCAGDGDRAEQLRQTCNRFDQKGKEAVTGLWLLGRRLGWNMSLNDRQDKLNVFRVTCSRGKLRKSASAVKRIRELPQPGEGEFVYDLETASHHFHVGPGNLVVHNTDSVMVKFPVSDVKDAMELGERAAREVSKRFPDPVKLEFEKVYFPYLLMNKKRYAGLYWTRPEKWDKLDTKGIETVRRDNCALVRQVVDTVLRKILIDRSVNKAVRYVKQVVADLLQGRVDISLLIITKALGKSARSEGYAAKQAHVELAERIRKRDPANAPSVGDRVPYVLTQAAKGTPAYLRSEDPLYVLEHRIPIDTQYYLDNQLSKPLTRIFAPIIQNPRRLFEGEHTRTISMKAPSGKKGIMAFAVKRLSCLAPGCNVPLNKGEQTVCRHHKATEPEIFRQRLEDVNALEDRFSRLWTQCQRCQGSLHQDVLCTNRDCPIFYMRKEVQYELDEASKVLDRFGGEW